MEAVHLSMEILALLFVVALLAGFVDTLAGGGGLITVPVLILTGLPPLMALGTNKLQACMGTATATLMMFKKKKLHWSQVRSLMLCAFSGAILGALFVQVISSKVLNVIVPIVLIIIALYFMFSSQLSVTARAPRVSGRVYRRTVIPVIGFYDGFFGPGTGSFFSLAGVSLRGQTLLEATAAAKAMNFATNIGSLIIFIFAGKVVWLVGFSMMLGQILGAWLGAHSLFRIDTRILRLLIVVVCVSMLIRYSIQMGWFD